MVKNDGQNDGQKWWPKMMAQNDGQNDIETMVKMIKWLSKEMAKRDGQKRWSKKMVNGQNDGIPATVEEGMEGKPAAVAEAVVIQ